MATLNAAQRAKIRRGATANWNGPVEHTRGDIDAAIQEIEDWFETHMGLFADINTATSPLVFSVHQKKLIMQHYCNHKRVQGMDV